ncbi:MAG: PAS domain-containing protein [Candidatus Cryosericum sp.]
MDRRREDALSLTREEAALRESEDRSAVVLAAVDDGLWDWNIASGKACFSPLYYQILGYEDRGFPATYDSWRLLIHPEDVDRVEHTIRESIESGHGFVIDLRMKKKSGEWLWVSARGKAIALDTTGKALRMVGTLTDITERKQAQIYGEMGREILQILIEPGSLHDSLQRILSTLRTWTGFDAVGMRLRDGEDFPYYVQEGLSGDFLLTENTLTERSADGGVCRDRDGNVNLECTCGLVISGKTDTANPLFTPGGSFWTNDSFPILDLAPNQDPRHNPRNRCIHAGYASIALIPIRSRNGIVGLIHLNDRRKGRLSLRAVELLEGIASYIGEALMRKQTEDDLAASHAALVKAQAIAHIGDWSIDSATRTFAWSDETYEIHGVNKSSRPLLMSD